MDSGRVQTFEWIILKKLNSLSSSVKFFLDFTVPSKISITNFFQLYISLIQKNIKGQITKNKLCKQKSASFDSSSQNSNYLFNNNQRRLTTNEGTTNKEFIKRRLLVFQEIETYRMRLLEAEEEQQKQLENIKGRIPPTTTLLSKGKVIILEFIQMTV